MELSPFETRARRAMRHGLWFSAAFTIVCGLLTLALANDVIAPAKDATITGLLAAIGALLFAAGLTARRIFLP